MDPVALRLRDALYAGFESYVRDRVSDLDPESAVLADAISAGQEMLAEGLDRLLSSSPSEQTATPLEVFRTALEPVTEALTGAAVAPRRGDSPVPGDPYHLVPGSAAEVSVEAGEAAVAWGADKASRLTRPLVIAVTTNLMDLSSFEAAVGSTGYEFEGRRESGPGRRRPAAAFVDLEAPGSDDAIRELSAAGTRVIAYGPHVDSFAMTRARSLGAIVAEPRSRVLRDPAAFLLPVV